jgi:hypothetical protein
VLNIIGIDQASFSYKDKRSGLYLRIWRGRGTRIRSQRCGSAREYFSTNENVFAELKEMLKLILFSDEMRKRSSQRGFTGRDSFIPHFFEGGPARGTSEIEI